MLSRDDWFWPLSCKADDSISSNEKSGNQLFVIVYHLRLQLVKKIAVLFGYYFIVMDFTIPKKSWIVRLLDFAFRPICMSQLISLDWVLANRSRIQWYHVMTQISSNINIRKIRKHCQASYCDPLEIYLVRKLLHKLTCEWQAISLGPLSNIMSM